MKILKCIGLIENERAFRLLSAFLTQRPPDDWPDALDHLAIGLVANKYTKLAKISEILLLSLGLSYMKIQLCYLEQKSLCRHFELSDKKLYLDVFSIFARFYHPKNIIVC